MGEFLTEELVERLGKASTLWVGGEARVFVGRDTRASGETLEDAFARGGVPENPRGGDDEQDAG